MFAKVLWKQFSTVEWNWLLKSQVVHKVVIKIPISETSAPLVVSILLLLYSFSHQAETQKTLALPSSYVPHPTSGTSRWCGRNSLRISDIWISHPGQRQREDTGRETGWAPQLLCCRDMVMLGRLQTSTWFTAGVNATRVGHTKAISLTPPTL